MISRKHVFEEVANPKDVEKLNDNKALFMAIYKAVYMLVRLELDIRFNQTKIAKKLGLELKNDQKVEKKKSVSNTVIKSTDQIEDVEDDNE